MTDHALIYLWNTNIDQSIIWAVIETAWRGEISVLYTAEKIKFWNFIFVAAKTNKRIFPANTAREISTN